MALIENLTPEKGKLGHTGVVHGDGFSGLTAAITFGAKPAGEIETKSDQVVKFKVPFTDASDRLPADPSKCLVNVAIGDASRSFIFQYDPPGDPPAITGFDPNEFPTAVTVTTKAIGSSLANAQGRKPTTVFLVELGITGEINAASITPGSFEFSVSSPNSRPIPAGAYTVVTGFNDGSGASGTLTLL